MDSPCIGMIGLTRQQLADKLIEFGLEPGLVKRLWNLMYVKGATDLSQLTSVSKAESKAAGKISDTWPPPHCSRPCIGRCDAQMAAAVLRREYGGSGHDP